MACGDTLKSGDIERQQNSNIASFFDLTGHLKAKRAYGWSHPTGADNKGERFVTVLEIPPVNSPQTAVKMSIYRDIKAGKIRQ
jgi:hypothetical protein